MLFRYTYLSYTWRTSRSKTSGKFSGIASTAPLYHCSGWK